MTAILAFIVLALLSWLVPAHRRHLVWLAISIGALYALQPPGPDFATVTLVIVVGVWWIVRRDPLTMGDRAALGLGALIGLAMAVLRGAAGTLSIGIGLAALSGSAVSALIPPLEEDSGTRGRLAVLWIAALVTALAALKTPALASAASHVLAAPGLSWFGFSYIAFRLIHALIDYRNGRVPPLTLADFALYVIFFPVLSAGPIDRVQHFLSELKAERPFEARYLVEGGGRIAWGMFRKFIIADSLAYFALSPALLDGGSQPRPLALWLMIYAYAFYIFFDFAGYSDIAIGIGGLLGVRLPENFNRPYTRPNIAAFWNAWHITLSSWYRDYVFTPLSRALLRAHWRPVVAAFIAQLVTMILIGVWHGVSWNFVAWGAWHGIGLYAHRQFAARVHWNVDGVSPFAAKVIRIGSVLLTFHFVALGWVFFALPSLNSSVGVFAGLTGIVHAR